MFNVPLVLAPFALNAYTLSLAPAGIKNDAPANSSGFDYVPTGASFLIPAGARLKVYAFNANGASTNGTLNIIATFNRLDTYK